MMRRWGQRRQLVSDSNTLLLTKSIFFQNTTLLKGAILTAPESRGERRFYGYAFRPDELDIVDAFSKGFYPKYLDWFPRELTDVSLPRRSGISGCAVIQSYICH